MAPGFTYYVTTLGPISPVTLFSNNIIAEAGNSVFTVLDTATIHIWTVRLCGTTLLLLARASVPFFGTRNRSSAAILALSQLLPAELPEVWKLLFSHRCERARMAALLRLQVPKKVPTCEREEEMWFRIALKTEI